MNFYCLAAFGSLCLGVFGVGGSYMEVALNLFCIVTAPCGSFHYSNMPCGSDGLCQCGHLITCNFSPMSNRLTVLCCAGNEDRVLRRGRAFSLSRVETRFQGVVFLVVDYRLEITRGFQIEFHQSFFVNFIRVLHCYPEIVGQPKKRNI